DAVEALREFAVAITLCRIGPGDYRCGLPLGRSRWGPCLGDDISAFARPRHRVHSLGAGGLVSGDGLRYARRRFYRSPTPRRRSSLFICERRRGVVQNLALCRPDLECRLWPRDLGTPSTGELAEQG